MNISAIAINQLADTWAAHASAATLISSTGTTDITGVGSVAIGGGALTSINSAIVNIGLAVNLAPIAPPRPPIPGSLAVLAKVALIGTPALPFVPGSPIPELAWYAGSVVAPEPVSKSTSILPQFNPGSIASSGYSSKDHTSGSGTGTTKTLADVSAATQTAATPLLDFIGNKESEGYDDISGLISRSLYPTKPLTKMTIAEVLNWQESIDSSQLSEASGRYQIMEDTLRGFNNDRGVGPGNPLYSRAGLSSGDMFDPVNQDKMAITLLNGRGLNRFLNNEITREQFANSLASEWASLPLVTGPNAGKSKYAGDAAGNRSLTSIQEFLSVIDQVKAGSDAILEGSITTGGAR
jgi:muramidase (phage lysozyme)